MKLNPDGILFSNKTVATTDTRRRFFLKKTMRGNLKA